MASKDPNAARARANKTSRSTHKRRKNVGRKLRPWLMYDLLAEQATAEAQPIKPRKRHKRKLHELMDDVASLGDKLWDIDRAFGTSKLTLRAAARLALDTVYLFLMRQEDQSHVLSYLNRALEELDQGITAPLLKPKRRGAGRKPDSSLVQQVKGSLAAIARVQMESGLGRKPAAAVVARKVPAELASCLSSKRFIRGRAIEEYMDLYDCGSELLKKFEEARERKRFITVFAHRMGKDDGSMRYFRADMKRLDRIGAFLVENVTEKKRLMHVKRKLNPSAGLFGFIVTMHGVASARAEGYEPSCDDLLERLRSFASDFDGPSQELPGG